MNVQGWQAQWDLGDSENRGVFCRQSQGQPAFYTARNSSAFLEQSREYDCCFGNALWVPNEGWEELGCSAEQKCNQMPLGTGMRAWGEDFDKEKEKEKRRRRQVREGGESTKEPKRRGVGICV